MISRPPGQPRPVNAHGLLTSIALCCALGFLGHGASSLSVDDDSSSSSGLSSGESVLSPGSSSGSSSSSSLSSSSSPGSGLLHAPDVPRFSALVDARGQPLLMGGKRGFSYRSEYKRLPLYQFGIGKRWAVAGGGGAEEKRRQPFSFGLGKRARDYSFGLGKRNGYGQPEEPLPEAAKFGYDGYMPADLMYDQYARQNALVNYLQSKRAASGGFNFGLGKRNVDMEDDAVARIEKLPMKHSRDKYLFGLGKRLYELQQQQQQRQDDEDMDEEDLA